MWLAPIAAIEYLEAALAFTSNHGLGMTIAQFDLTNRPAGCLPKPAASISYLFFGRLRSRLARSLRPMMSETILRSSFGRLRVNPNSAVNAAIFALLLFDIT